VDIVAAVRRDPRHQEIAVACFAIADGVINRTGAWLAHGQPRE
jgi:hypothetical protein